MPLPMPETEPHDTEATLPPTKSQRHDKEVLHPPEPQPHDKEAPHPLEPFQFDLNFQNSYRFEYSSKIHLTSSIRFPNSYSISIKKYQT
jgi:hypothetical protein